MITLVDVIFAAEVNIGCLVDSKTVADYEILWPYALLERWLELGKG